MGKKKVKETSEIQMLVISARSVYNDVSKVLSQILLGTVSSFKFLFKFLLIIVEPFLQLAKNYWFVTEMLFFFLLHFVRQHIFYCVKNLFMLSFGGQCMPVEIMDDMQNDSCDGMVQKENKCKS